VSVDLPDPWPTLPSEPAKLLTWASMATKHKVVATYRPGVHEHAGLVVELEGGHELFFETVGEACRPDRFITPFMSIDGVPMRSYSGPQIREIVGALVRAARLGRERDQRETFTDLGARYLTGCLAEGGRIVQDMGDPLGEYRGVLKLKQATRLLRGDELERWPELLHAPDLAAMFIVRGLFLAYSKRVVGRMNTAVFNEHMRRVGWQDIEFNPRKPGDPAARRPHLRVWRVPDGWDDVWAEEAAERGPVVPRGPGSASRARGRTSFAKDHPGPRDQPKGTRMIGPRHALDAIADLIGLPRVAVKTVERRGSNGGQAAA
jgi:hypothetical protein